MAKIKIGTKVLCRFFNTPDRKFYGDYFSAEVTEISPIHLFGGEWLTGYVLAGKAFKVVDEKGFFHILKRKEIKRILE